MLARALEVGSVLLRAVDDDFDLGPGFVTMVMMLVVGGGGVGVGVFLAQGVDVGR